MWVADVSRARTSVDAVFNVLGYFPKGRVHASGFICIASDAAAATAASTAIAATIDDDGVSFAAYLAVYRTYH